MNNSWNKFIYKAWAPIYDSIFNAGPFLKARGKVFQDVQFQYGDKVLFVGVGTGADIEKVAYERLDVTAIDYSDDMLKKARVKFNDSKIIFLKMDAQHLDFPDGYFDYVVGSLILSVVPDSGKALGEMERVCRKDGKILIFDKFADPGKGLSGVKKAMRYLVKPLGTDIGISFEEIYQKKKAELVLMSDVGVMFGNMYRRILLKKV